MKLVDKSHNNTSITTNYHGNQSPRRNSEKARKHWFINTIASFQMMR